MNITKNFLTTLLIVAFITVTAITSCTHNGQVSRTDETGVEEWILFISDRSGEDRLYLMHPDDLEVYPFTIEGLPEKGRLDRPIWSTVNSKYFFSASLESNSDIFSTSWDGKDTINLTQTPQLFEGDPRPSPSGRYLAYTGVAKDLDIFLLDLTTNEKVNLTDHPARDIDPHWSPDGSSILFVSNRQGTPNIYVTRPNSGEFQNLSHGSGQDAAPSWSPDGERILFQSDRDGGIDLFVMSKDGSSLTNITNHPAMDFDPLWSPDGNWILFLSDRSEGMDLYRIEPNGENLERITNTPNEREFSYSFSPDSQNIIFVVGANDQLDIYLWTAIEKEPIRMTKDKANDYEPLWVRIEAEP